MLGRILLVVGLVTVDGLFLGSVLRSLAVCLLCLLCLGDSLALIGIKSRDSILLLFLGKLLIEVLLVSLYSIGFPCFLGILASIVLGVALCLARLRLKLGLGHLTLGSVFLIIRIISVNGSCSFLHGSLFSFLLGLALCLFLCLFFLAFSILGIGECKESLLLVLGLCLLILGSYVLGNGILELGCALLLTGSILRLALRILCLCLELGLGRLVLGSIYLIVRIVAVNRLLRGRILCRLALCLIESLLLGKSFLLCGVELLKSRLLLGLGMLCVVVCVVSLGG